MKTDTPKEPEKKIDSSLAELMFCGCVMASPDEHKASTYGLRLAGFPNEVKTSEKVKDV